jgi:hypothetical protein
MVFLACVGVLCALLFGFAVTNKFCYTVILHGIQIEISKSLILMIIVSKLSLKYLELPHIAISCLAKYLEASLVAVKGFKTKDDEL